MKIGFVCNTEAQAKMFISVMEAFLAPDVDFFWISLDKYYFWKSEKPLDAAGIEYISLPRKNSAKRFTNLTVPEMYWALHFSVQPIVEELLTELQLDVILFGNDRGLIEKQLITQAKKQNIKTVLLQDGLLWRHEVRRANIGHLVRSLWNNSTPTARPADYAKELLRTLLHPLGLAHLAPSYFGEGNCDAICVMGNSSRNVLLERKISEERIFITGQPRFQKLSTQQRETTRYPNEPDSSSATKVTFFSAASPGIYAESQRELVPALIQYVEKRAGEMSLTIKPHPRDTEQDYKAILDGKLHSKISDERDSFIALAKTDIALVWPSTMIVESMLLSKPIITIKMQKMPGIADSLGISAGLLQEVSSACELIYSLEPESLLSLDRATQDLKESLISFETCAAEQVVSVVYRVAGVNGEGLSQSV